MNYSMFDSVYLICFFLFENLLEKLKQNPIYIHNDCTYCEIK